MTSGKQSGEAEWNGEYAQARQRFHQCSIEVLIS